MIIYVNMDNCRLGFCPVYAAVVGFVILASVYLTLYGCLYAYMCIFIDCNSKIDFRHVYGLYNGIGLLYYIPVHCFIMF